MTAEEISRHIFYLPATNGKAEESIKEGARLIEEYKEAALQATPVLPEDGLLTYEQLSELHNRRKADAAFWEKKYEELAAEYNVLKTKEGK